MCLSRTPAPALAPLLSTITDKGMRATTHKTTDNNLQTHYMLTYIAHDNFFRFDTTSFLQNPILAVESQILAVNLKCENLNGRPQGPRYYFVPYILILPSS